jgi:hypothetical protein
MPEQAFEPQAVASGTVFTELTPLALTTVDELFPYSTVFDDKLYVVYQREDFCGTVKFFVVLTSFDADGWSDEQFLSSPDLTTPIRSELNLNPRIGASDEALFVTWTSNEPNWTSGPDDDVVFRFSRDGSTWSEVIEITSHYNTGLDKLPRVIHFKGRTLFLWETNDPIDSDGMDMDIVMRSWDGHELGQVIEVTPSGDATNDNNVQVATDGDLMYLTWMKKNYTAEGANVYDVWGRVFDGRDWVTPPFMLSTDAPVENEHPTVVAGDGDAFFLWQTHDTPRHSDQSAIVMRHWSPQEGLGLQEFVSSLTSNGEDSQPDGIWWNDRLYITWLTNDQGISFGEDADLVYRTGILGPDGRMDFEDILEISDSRDDYTDWFPTFVVYDDVVNMVWVVDTNYTDQFPPEVLEPLGGIIRSPDVVIKSIDIPFEKSLSLVYSLGTAVPTASKATSAQVVVKDLSDKPMEDLRVGLRYMRTRADPGTKMLRLLDEEGDGVYAIEDLEFARDGPYRVTIVIDDVEVSSFIVDVAAPPPSFIDRVPTTSIFFLMAGVVTGGLLYRAMGRDDLVEELRPAPLELLRAGGE